MVNADFQVGYTGCWPSLSSTGNWLGLLFSLITMALLTRLLLPAHLSASLGSALEPRGGLRTRPHGLLRVPAAWEFVCVAESIPVWVNTPVCGLLGLCSLLCISKCACVHVCLRMYTHGILCLLSMAHVVTCVCVCV